jgi:hypothetical protein
MEVISLVRFMNLQVASVMAGRVERLTVFEEL